MPGAAEAAGDLALGSDATVHTGGLRGELRATDLRPLATLFGRPERAGSGDAHGECARAARCARRDGQASPRVVSGARAGARPTWTRRLAVHGLGSPEANAEAHGTGRDVALGERRLTDVQLDGTWRGALASARVDFDLRAREASGRHQLTREPRRVTGMRRASRSRNSASTTGATRGPRSARRSWSSAARARPSSSSRCGRRAARCAFAAPSGAGRAISISSSPDSTSRP